jgi:hypothetical protein
MLRDKGFAPIFKKKPECIPLQAADLLAYEHFLGARDIFDRGIDAFESLRYPVRQLAAIPHQPEDWATYTRENLLQFCAEAKIPRR